MSSHSLINNYLNFIGRILPKPQHIPTIGFDIGTSFVKAVEMRDHAGMFQIERWAVEPIESSDTKAALKSLIGRLNLTDQEPVVSVSGKGTLIRYIDMPRMSVDELRKSIVYEIDKYFPFDPQSIYTDCHIIDPNSTEKKMSVLVVAAKKEIVDERIKLFKDLGMELSQVTTNSIAMANAFEGLIKGQTMTGATAILDIGGSVSSLMILDKNLAPRFTRDIFIGSQDFSKQIANTLGIEIKEADKIKRSPDQRLSEINKACEATMENFTSEMHLSFDYFITEKNLSVEALYLVGGGSLFKGIEKAFETNLNIPVKIWNPLSGIKVSPSASVSDINSYASQLGVAIGLALTKI